MTIQLMFHNPISNNEDYLVFEESVIDYCNWRNIKDTKTDNDICEILNLLLIYLDCSRMLSGMPINRTTNIRYKDELGEYWYYLLKFNNQLLYNEYFNKLINLHTKNIIVEHSRIKEDKPKATKTKKPKVKNCFFVVRKKRVRSFCNSLCPLYIAFIIIANGKLQKGEK